MKNTILLFLALTAWASAQPFNTPHYHRTASAPAFAVAVTDSTVMWLEGDKIAGKSNLDTMYAWLDTTASGLHMFQPTASYKPLYIASAVNGLPAVRFDGTDDHLRRDSVANNRIARSNGMVMYYVMKQASSKARNTVFYKNDNLATRRISTLHTFDDTHYWDFAGDGATARTTVAQAAGWDDAWHVVEVYKSGDSMQIVIDDTVRVTKTDATARLATWYTSDMAIGIYLGSLSSSPYKGDLAAFVICKGVMPASRRAAYRAYLKQKYGTP